MTIGSSLPAPVEMYRALVRRDPAYEGVFWVGVRTTRIVCRPTCAARKPLAGNTEFFPRLADALAAGYRPCRRCRPLEPGGTPSWVAALLERIERSPHERLTDADLRRLDLDPGRVRRWFRRTHGLTFQAYQRSLRLGAALGRLTRGDDVTGTAFAIGYESLSGFREAFSRLFGEPPSRLRHATPLAVSRLDTPLGPMIGVAADAGLCLLEFADRRMLATQLARVRARFGGPVTPGMNAPLQSIARELGLYFAGRLRRFETSLLLDGTAFQRQVWERLREIPSGETISYDRLAREVGRPGAQRAVGRANGDNRLAIVVPCHRVVRADGSLCGYGGGLWRKQRLLEHEGVQPARLVSGF